MHKLEPAKTYVLSLGGSLIIPTTGFDIEFLSQFNQFIRKYVNAGRRFFITCGGGATAREYSDAAAGVVGEDLKNVDRDWLGIHSSRLNGHLMRTIFRDIAYRNMLNDYSLVDKNAKQFKVVIAAGWKPGWSTDYCATLVAEDYNVPLLINMSNIDMVYDKDPSKYKDAKPIEHMHWDDIIAMMDKLLKGKKWIPMLNSPFDPVATEKKAKEIGLKVVICNGKNLKNVQNIIEGKEFVGTLIENPNQENKRT